MMLVHLVILPEESKFESLSYFISTNKFKMEKKINIENKIFYEII